MEIFFVICYNNLRLKKSVYNTLCFYIPNFYYFSGGYSNEPEICIPLLRG